MDPGSDRAAHEWEEGYRIQGCEDVVLWQKDAADRQTIVEFLPEKLKQDDKTLVGNAGYRKYLEREAEQGPSASTSRRFSRMPVRRLMGLARQYPAIDPRGTFQYKQLWRVEQAFRAMKSVLETRPIYHECHDTVRGHVFCSFLALVLMKELLSRRETGAKGCEWEDIKRNVAALHALELRFKGNALSPEERASGLLFRDTPSRRNGGTAEPAPLNRRFGPRGSSYGDGMKALRPRCGRGYDVPAYNCRREEAQQYGVYRT
jgi:hypothetical protein